MRFSLFLLLESVCDALHGYKVSNERRQGTNSSKTKKKPEKVSIESLPFFARGGT